MATYTDELKKLTGTQRDAAAGLIGLFSQYGLNTLAGRIIDMVKQGFSADTMSVMLEETPEYKKRFAANDQRVKNGLAKLSPKEYLDTERAYRAVMTQSGMPKGFYDSTDDYTKFLANDLSPTELKDRVGMWQQEALKDKAGLDSIRKITGLGVSDYAAYLMDPSRATPLLTKTAQAISFAAAGERHGYDITKDLATMYGTKGVTADQAEQGFSTVQDVQANTDRLAKLYQMEGYSVADATAEVFGGDASQAAKRKKAASAERATFSDNSRGKTGKSGGLSNY